MITEEQFQALAQKTHQYKTDLRRIISSKTRSTVAGFLDLGIIAGLPYLIYKLDLVFLGQNNAMATGVTLFIIFISIHILMLLLLGGRSMGSFICHIQMIDIRTLKPLSFDDYTSLAGKRIVRDFQHHDWYEAYDYLGSRYNQDMAMRELGFIIVDTNKLKLFKTKYQGFKPISGSYEHNKHYDELSETQKERRSGNARSKYMK